MTPALLAATVYALWDAYAPESAAAIGKYVAFALAFVLRLSSFAYDIKLPARCRAREQTNERTNERTNACRSTRRRETRRTRALWRGETRLRATLPRACFDGRPSFQVWLKRPKRRSWSKSDGVEFFERPVA